MSVGRRLLVRIVGVVVLSLVFCTLGSCSDGSDQDRSAGSTSVVTARPAALEQATALDDLTAFLDAARIADSGLRAAEEMIARDVSTGNGTLKIQKATASSVVAVDLAAVADAVPRGLGPQLFGSVLTVYSGLVSRRAAMLFFEHPSTFDYAEDGEVDDGYPAESVVKTYQKGQPAAQRFAADLRAVESLARTAPPVRKLQESSRAAALRAAALAAVDAQNTCRTVGGGFVVTDVPAVTWNRDPEGGHSSSGNTFRARGFDTLSFDIRYRAKRWSVDISSC